MSKKYIVRLTEEERKGLEDLVSKGKAAAYKIKHANVPLKVVANEADWSDEQVAEVFSYAARTVPRFATILSTKGLRTHWSARHASAHPLS